MNSVNMQLRLQLTDAISQCISSKGITQTRAAELLGVTQPRVSNLMKKKINLFTIDMLVTMLHRLGYQVEISLS